MASAITIVAGDCISRLILSLVSIISREVALHAFVKESCARSLTICTLLRKYKQKERINISISYKIIISKIYSYSGS